MKLHKIMTALAAPALLASMVSCDDIAEDDRIKPVDKIVSDRVVLVQEFSGMMCSNCPLGADAIHSMIKAYPENIVAVGMHPEGVTFTRPLRGLDLTSKIATYMYDFYGRPTEFPQAVFNGDVEEMSKNYALWPAEAIKRLLDAPILKIDLDATYSEGATDELPEGRVVTANYTVEFQEETTENLNLCVWLVENDIVGGQTQPNGRPIYDYVHQHVLRASLTEDAGKNLGGSFKIDQKAEGSVQISIDPKWKPENCQIVAYVYNTADKSVKQAGICDITIEN